MSFPENQLNDLCRNRILILDGAMGTMLQVHRLTEADYRGDRFRGHPVDLRGCNDLLCLTRPAVVRQVHLDYLAAGADIIETNTFNATPISLEDYRLQHVTKELNEAAARLAREAANQFTAQDPTRPRLVAGAIGPTRATLSLSPDVGNPGFRTHTFDQVAEGYAEQISGLLLGGVDILLVETVFDTLTLKACLVAVEERFQALGQRVPVMVSVTFSDQSFRTLSGQTPEAFWYSIEHADLLSVGVNCGLAPGQMRPAIEELSGLAPVYFSCYLNAGLPNEMGEYDESPDQVAQVLRGYADQGMLNIVGGCCGTTPDHIRAIATAVEGCTPRVPPSASVLPRFSGLEPFVVRPDGNLTMIGERTNVTGSRRFAKLILDNRFEEAVEVAREQVTGGANLIDVNMDEGLLDSAAAMTEFLNRVAAEPDIARVPVMVDSSSFRVIEAGLRCLQGKGVVNSVSLKEGEETFRQQAMTCRRYGAAMVVMAFDEQGQATEVDRKVAICRRAYRILTEELGIPAREILFDPNILTVATGLEEHLDYARNYLDAIQLIKDSCPGSLVSGGVSNISFSFRGQDRVREAIHAVFLYHAIRAGMDVGIVNAGQLAVYEEVDPELRQRIEEVLFNRRPDATERLLELASAIRGQAAVRVEDLGWRQGTVEERLCHAMLQGRDDWVEEDLQEALTRYPTPLEIIEGPLMDGMNRVGELFGAGKMFLPQVVKSARVMKRAVAFLQPHLEAAQQDRGQAFRGRILMATVKGDVHDIGKNIVGVVLGCNNYQVIDLGVMVPADRILRVAREEQVDLIGLSGLITPSLDEMVHVARELEREGFQLPLLIGGATTSAKHTAVKIAPVYSGPVVHVLDASRAPAVVGQAVNPESRARLAAETRAAQQRLQEAYQRGDRARELVPIAQARAHQNRIKWSAYQAPVPEFTGVRHQRDLPLAEIVPYIDWSPFFHVWELRGGYPRILTDPVVGVQARQLFADGQRLLEKVMAEEWLRAEAIHGFFPANSEGDDIVVYRDSDRRVEAARFATLRQQSRKRDAEAVYHALADFVAPSGSGVADYLGAFAVTAGIGIEDHVARLEAEHDDYQAILLKALADRLAEALAELVHERARRDWGYGRHEELTKEDLIRERYQGIRPAPGYPACPDHTDKRTIFELLEVEERGSLRLTETYAMHPAASVSGLYLAHPEARYFAVGPIGQDQVEEYARRKGIPIPEVERWLSPNLGYQPSGR
ncbi:MAG: methionine synthase [Candidatus Latescibacterota bacterium]|jgi:5-methyltetrahydrofolate--homocysteine methyltransferase